MNDLHTSDLYFCFTPTTPKEVDRIREFCIEHKERPNAVLVKLNTPCYINVYVHSRRGVVVFSLIQVSYSDRVITVDSIDKFEAMIRAAILIKQ